MRPPLAPPRPHRTLRPSLPPALPSALAPPNPTPRPPAPQEIDAYWLQRKISKAYGDIDPNTAQRLAEDVFAALEVGAGASNFTFIILLSSLFFLFTAVAWRRASLPPWRWAGSKGLFLFSPATHPSLPNTFNHCS